MRIIDKPTIQPCENCGTFDGVLYRSSMTAYHFEGIPESPEDPNRSLPMCEACWEDYYQYWKSMWDEYNSSRGC